MVDKLSPLLTERLDAMPTPKLTDSLAKTMRGQMVPPDGFDLAGPPPVLKTLSPPSS